MFVESRLSEVILRLQFDKIRPELLALTVEPCPYLQMETHLKEQDCISEIGKDQRVSAGPNMPLQFVDLATARMWATPQATPQR